MSDVAILAMPIKRFWLFSDCIERMKASDGVHGIQVAAAVLSQDIYESTLNKLSETVGTIVISESERDENAIANMKRKLTMGR
jgi:hypothetical protein